MTARTASMSDPLEPPAKRARFEEAGADADQDVPGSPVDDMDDDFYDEPTPVKAAMHAVDTPATAAPQAAAGTPLAGLPSLQLPGLSLFKPSDPTTTHHSQQQAPLTQPSLNNDEPDASDVADPDPLYDDEKPAQTEASPATATTKAESRENVSDAPAASEAAAPAQNEAGEAVKGPPADDDFESKADFLAAAEANKGKQDAEWELDSQAPSSDDSSSSSSDDSSDSDSSDEGELLDPEEQVRLLMKEDADDGGASGPAAVRTQNEVEEVFEKPDITVTPQTKKTELGKVESVVDNMILIKANTSGHYRVLESGSALCLADGTVIGKVADTIGRVEEPRYSVGFADAAEIKALGINKDTTIYYVDEHSTFVLTEPLKHMKFTDASNLHDEEADVEFSDDEKEAEHKRKLKEEKRARNDAKHGHDRQTQDKPRHTQNNDAPAKSQQGQYQGGGLNYGSDEDDDLGMYKPLPRPDHFENIVGAGAPIEDRSHVRRGNRGRGGWPDRGRGFRGRGRGGGDMGPGRGGHNQRGNQRGGRGGPAGHAGHQERGGRHQNSDRGRQPHRENRAASSASPNRQNHQNHQNRGGRGGSQQHSPARSRKQNRHAASPPAATASPAPTSTNAYAQNANVTSNAWSMPGSSTAAPPAYPTYSTPQPAAIPAGAYVNPAFYPQQQQAPAAPQAQNPQQTQQNLAQWAQWLQLAAAMQQAQGQQQQQQQQQPHYGQPPAQTQAPPPPPPPQNYGAQPAQQQGGGQSLQDILRALGGGAPQGR